ncbi:MAG: glycosyl transferase family 2 [Candidatus Hydrogenedentota bacterium]
MAFMRIVTLIQARMGSTRLPGKALIDLAGMPVLDRVVRRCQSAKTTSAVVIATTTEPDDDRIAQSAARLEVPVFRGSRDDVLDRFVSAAKEHSADYVIRVTADCPLIDPEWIDACVNTATAGGVDYVANDGEGFVRGFDVEAVTRTALETAWRDAREDFERVHVTPYLYRHPEQFAVSHLGWPGAPSQCRLTLDTKEDLHLLEGVFQHFHGSNSIGWRDAVRLLERNPDLAAINKDVSQKSLEEG